ncbi:MAG: RidA family protein [Verrucomicrobia bacterium]|nr:RidA family protein [Verrucomicrobiota bacterium]
MEPVEGALEALGLQLPLMAAPGGNYVPYVRWGDLLFLAGVISTRDGQVITGTVGVDKTIEEAHDAARWCALSELATIKQALGSLDQVERIISLNGYVNSVPGFVDSPKVINGASDLFAKIYGDRGLHARAAIGVSGLPRNALVEIQMVVGVRKDTE